MRERILDALPPVVHRRFLVYIMGPYTAYDIEDLIPADTDPDDISFPIGDWDPTEGDYTEAEALDLLKTARDRLRDDAGVNAFLAIDIGIELDDMDAATQTIRFARASNAIAFIVPHVGKNLGVGIETGAVLESLDGTDHERVVFIHEEGVSSAMINSLSTRWDAAIRAYSDLDELIHHLRQFCLSIMYREQYGGLPQRDTE